MSEQEILEGNKLIAEFIDLTPHDMFPDELQAPDEFKWMAVKINVESDYDKLENEFISFENYFEFHSSWDWLMPVVKKCLSILDLLLRKNVKDDYSDYDWSYMQQISGFKEKFKWCFEKPDINSCFAQVIEFIKWYNSNEQKKH